MAEESVHLRDAYRWRRVFGGVTVLHEPRKINAALRRRRFWEATMGLDLEVMQIRSGELMSRRSHLRPYHAARRRFHSESELHEIGSLATRSRASRG